MSRRADQIKELFEQALDLPEDERTQFLARLQAEEPELGAEVGGLLGALASASGFLTEQRGQRPIERPGTVIDRFELGEQLGEGGFGVVFRATQREPVKRDVALKILKLGIDDRSVVARFEREQKALAHMQHANIATVLDGGTTPSGRPYFVMEYVDGVPITTYCREQGLGVEERVELLLQVCQAVQHAHQKGIVHRDLKPANILVARDTDGTPLPKVIDFGIAKALDADADGHSHEFTGTLAGQAIGTIEYMPPEQALGHLELLDSRADVYSLGVVLYELLAGRRPFERNDAPDRAGRATMIERIRDEVPRRPSAQVRSSQDELPLPGADRNQWSRRLSDDLDWITTRALAKRPEERYPTANALAADLRNYLERRPVAAGPPTTGYVLRRMLSRHRALALTTAALMLTVLGGFIATSKALADTRHEAASKARTVAAMKELLLSADPMQLRGPEFTVQQMLDEFAPQIDSRFAHDPDVQLELHVIIGGAYRNLSQLGKAAPHLEQSVALARRQGDTAMLVKALSEYAAVLRSLGDYDRALEVVAEARAGVDDHTPPLQRARLLLTEADLYRLSDHDDRGEPLVHEALPLLDHADQAIDPNAPSAVNDDPALEVAMQRALAHDLLGAFAHKRNDVDAALRHFGAARDLRSARLPEHHPLIGTSWSNLASVHLTAGNGEAALAATNGALSCYRATFGENHPQTAAALTKLGELELSRGNAKAAREHLEKAHSIRQETLPKGHRALASTPAILGRMTLLEGDNSGAEALLREAVAARRESDAPEDRSFAGMLQNLAIAIERQQRSAEALPLYQEALALHRSLDGAHNLSLPGALQNVAQCLERLGDPAGAVPLLQERLAVLREQTPDDHAALLAACLWVARTAERAGKPRLAAEHRVAAIAQMEQLGREPGQLTAERARAGRLFLAAGDHEQALPLLDAAWQWCEANVPDEWPSADCQAMLARCHVLRGDWQRAVACAERTRAVLGHSEPPPQIRRSCLEAIAISLEAAAAAEQDPTRAAAFHDDAAATRRQLTVLPAPTAATNR